jgi:hydroxymethylpyrimidine pyrophosphatase-like HAD family hydrolase
MKYRVIAVDFDKTIAESNYPHCGTVIPKAGEVLRKYHSAGGQIIIWTCRTSGDLDNAVRFLIDNNVPFDAVNEHLPWQIEEFHKLFPHVNPDGRKLSADLYIDDKDPYSQLLGYVNWSLVEKLLEV